MKLRSYFLLVAVFSLCMSAFGQKVYQTRVGTFTYEQKSGAPAANGNYMVKLNGQPMFLLKTMLKDRTSSEFGSGAYSFVSIRGKYTISYRVYDKDDGFEIQMRSPALEDQGKDLINFPILKIQKENPVTCSKADLMDMLSVDVMSLHFPAEMPFVEGNTKLGTFKSTTEIDDYEYRITRNFGYKDPFDMILTTKIEGVTNVFKSNIDFETERNGIMKFNIPSQQSFFGILAIAQDSYIEFKFEKDKVTMTDFPKELLIFDPAKVSKVLNQPQSVPTENGDMKVVFDLLYDLMWDDLQNAISQNLNREKKIWFYDGKVEVLEDGKVVETFKGKEVEAAKNVNKLADAKKKFEEDKSNFEKRVAALEKFISQPPDGSIEVSYTDLFSREHKFDGEVQRYKIEEEVYNGNLDGTFKGKEHRYFIHGNGKLTTSSEIARIKRDRIYEGKWIHGCKYGIGKEQEYVNGRLEKTITGTWKAHAMHGKDFVVEDHKKNTIEKGEMYNNFRRGVWTVKNVSNQSSYQITYNDYGVEISRTQP